MGITLHPLISRARNWTFYLVYLMMALNGGVTFSRACLDVGLDGCRTERREGQSSLTVGGEGETFTDAAQECLNLLLLSHFVSTSISPQHQNPIQSLLFQL